MEIMKILDKGWTKLRKNETPKIMNETRKNGSN